MSVCGLWWLWVTPLEFRGHGDLREERSKKGEGHKYKRKERMCQINYFGTNNMTQEEDLCVSMGCDGYFLV